MPATTFIATAEHKTSRDGKTLTRIDRVLNEAGEETGRRTSKSRDYVALRVMAGGDVLSAHETVEAAMKAQAANEYGHTGVTVVLIPAPDAEVRTPEARDALGDDWAADVKARRTERDEAAAALGAARAEAGSPANDLRLRDIWDGLDLEQRRAALRLFWKEIRWGSGGTAGRARPSRSSSVGRGTRPR